MVKERFVLGIYVCTTVNDKRVQSVLKSPGRGDRLLFLELLRSSRFLKCVLEFKGAK